MIPRIGRIGILAITTAAVFAPSIQAQNNSEFSVFRQMIEKQGKQIEILTLEVELLRKAVEANQKIAKGESAAPVAPAATPVTPATTPATTEFAIPAAVPVPAPSANTHIVVKGESLDSIAKLHKTTISELQKLNKITDPKKLQIGQSLQVPPNPEQKTAQ